MTGVPLTRLEKEEAQRLLELENELHKKVVSQTRRSRRQQDDSRALGLKIRIVDGSFLFLGPRCRQDAAVQALAEFMFGDAMRVQIDMSEYMETQRHGYRRRPGYVGYEEAPADERIARP